MTDFIRRRPIVSFYILAYLVPAICYAALVVPKLLAGRKMLNTDALLMFPIMELGIFIAALILTRITEGRAASPPIYSFWGCHLDCYPAYLRRRVGPGTSFRVCCESTRL